MKREKSNDYGLSLNSKALKKIGLSSITVLVIIISVYYFALGILKLFQQEVTVSGFAWDKTQIIEMCKTVSKNDWSLPNNARLIKSQKEIHHYAKIVDYYETIINTVPRQRAIGSHKEVTGHRDLGNGCFEEITRTVFDYETYYVQETKEVPVYKSVPVYKIKYYYDIDKWVFSRNIESSGNDKNDYIGEYTLKSTGDTEIGTERLGILDENYYIKVVDNKGREKQYRITEEEWRPLTSNQTIKIKVNIFGEVKVSKKK